jgi:phosphoribosylanthranilate isomerase
MIDSPVPGSGQVFDWRLAEGAPANRKLLVAGGLTPENVGDAIRRIRPWGVDVATGVEISPGRKDAVKLKAFVEAARRAEPREYSSAATDRPFDWADDFS